MIELPSLSVLLVGTGIYLMSVAVTLRTLRGSRGRKAERSRTSVPENDVPS